MCGKNFIKRAIPFFLTFVIGISIASLFVTVSAPSFRFNNGFKRHREYHRMMELENQRLREENFRLKQEFSDREHMSVFDLSSGDLSVPPPPPLPPAEPPVQSIRR